MSGRTMKRGAVMLRGNLKLIFTKAWPIFVRPNLNFDIFGDLQNNHYVKGM